MGVGRLRPQDNWRRRVDILSRDWGLARGGKRRCRRRSIRVSGFRAGG